MGWTTKPNLYEHRICRANALGHTEILVGPRPATESWMAMPGTGSRTSNPEAAEWCVEEYYGKSADDRA